MHDSQQHIIPIITPDGISDVFSRANFDILKKYADSFAPTLTYKEKILILKDIWEREYKVKILYSDEYGFCWDKIQFKTEADRTLFLLTWSENAN